MRVPARAGLVYSGVHGSVLHRTDQAMSRDTVIVASFCAFLAFAGLVLLLAGSCSTADAIKHDPDPVVELERTRTELRLRTAELTVTRGQLRACERRAQ